MPAYADNAFSPADGDTLTKFSSVAFADPGTRSFPLHDSGAIFASVVHGVYHGVSDTVFDRLFKAACAHGIVDDIDHVLNVLDAGDGEKVASTVPSPVELYALPSKTAYLINNPSRLGATGKQLEADYGHIPILDYADACLGLTKAATAAGRLGSIPDSILRYGNSFVPAYPAAKGWLLKRAAMVKEPYTQMYKEAAVASAELSNEDARDFVSFIGDLDKSAGITGARLKGERMPDAFKLVFSEMTEERLNKKASVSFLIDGKVIPMVAIKAIPSDITLKNFRQNVGDVLTKIASAETVSDELRQQVNSLPPSVRTAIISLAVAYGPNEF